MVDTPSESTSIHEAVRILKDNRTEAEAEEEAQEAEQPEPEEVTPSGEAREEAGAETGAEETEHEEDDPRVTIQVDGTEREITLSELQNGYLRQQDYTRKTQDLADNRRKIESEEQDIAQRRQDLSSRLDAMGDALGDAPPFSKADIDKAKAEGDFTESNRMFQENMEFKEHRQNIEAQRNELLSDIHKDALKKFNAELPQAIPDWTDTKIAKAESTEVYEYLRDQGYNDGWIGNLVDAKAVAMVRKAMLFDRGEKDKPRLQKKVASAPRMLKPGTPRPKAASDKDTEKKILKSVDESTGTAALRNAAKFLKQRRG